MTLVHEPCSQTVRASARAANAATRAQCAEPDTETLRFVAQFVPAVTGEDAVAILRR